ncbi:unnamed protein product [Nezara viridula]|uniref:Uncharacterized protein n=1 Tax=Nezara viridula TaxID=85310 RepID=A0A9P0HL05_NEZVI|nr:unnamed protein product [Nezara viridula]
MTLNVSLTAVAFKHVLRRYIDDSEQLTSLRGRCREFFRNSPRRMTPCPLKGDLTRASQTSRTLRTSGSK